MVVSNQAFSRVFSRGKYARPAMYTTVYSTTNSEVARAIWASERPLLGKGHSAATGDDVDTLLIRDLRKSEGVVEYRLWLSTGCGDDSARQKQDESNAVVQKGEGGTQQGDGQDRDKGSWRRQNRGV